MASIIDIEFRASANFSDLVSQVNIANAQIQKLSLSMRKLNAEGFGSAVNSFTRALSSSGQFNTQSLLIDNGITKFGKALDAGNLNLQNSSRALRDFVRGRDGQIKQLARQQVMLERSVWTPTGRTAQGQMRGVLSTPTGLPSDVATNAAVATRQMQIFHSVLNETSKGLVNWGKNTQWAGRQMMVGLSIPLSIFGTVAAKTFMNFDKELTRLSRVYGSSITSSGTQAIDAIKKQVTELAGEISKALGIPAAETAALAADLAATGLEGEKLLGAVKQTSILATLGEVDRQDAMKTTLSLQNVFGASTKKLTEDINFLNAVENQTTASIQDLTTAIPKAGPVVRGLGGDVKDLATMLVAMKEGGIPAGEAANAIKSSLSSLINPTKEVSKYMKGFGIDLTEIVDKNAGKLMPTLTEFQGKLNALDDLSRQRVLEKLFGKMQVGRITALFNNLNQEGSQSVQVMKLAGTAAADLATLTEQELSKAANSVSGKFKRATEDLKANLVPIGEQFLKFGTSVLGVLDKIITKFNNLPSGFKQFLIGLATLTALVGPVIMLVGVFANFAGYLLRFGVLLAAFKKGGLQAFRYLTAEEMAAKLAGDKLTQTMFDQTKATNVFKEAVGQLALQFKDLADSANAAAKATSSASQSPAGRAASARVAIPSAVSVGSSTQVAQEPASLVAPTGEQLTESYKRMAAGGVAGRYLLSAADPNIVSSDGKKFKDRDAYNRSHLLSKTDPFWNNRALSGLGLMPSPSWKNQMQAQMSEADPRFGFSTSLRESAPSEENRKIAADSARDEVDAAKTELAAAKKAARAKNAGADAATRVAEAEVKLAAVTETYRQKLFEASSYKASEVRKTQATMFGQTRYLAENPEQAAVIGKELQQLSPAARQKKMQDLGIGGEDDQAFIKKVQESTKKRAARKLQAELDAETQAAKAADPAYKRLAKSSSEYKYRLAKYETDEFNKSLVRLEQGLQARARAAGYDIRTPLYGGGGASSGMGHLTPSSVSTPEDTAASKALTDAKIAHARKLNELTASLSTQEAAGADLSEAQVIAAEALTKLTGQRELAELNYTKALDASAKLAAEGSTNTKAVAAAKVAVAEAEALLVTAINAEIGALGGLTTETVIETEQYRMSNPNSPETTTPGNGGATGDTNILAPPGEGKTGRSLPSMTKVGMAGMAVGSVGSLVGPKQGVGANIATGLMSAGVTTMMVGQMVPAGSMAKLGEAITKMTKLGGVTGAAGRAMAAFSSAVRVGMLALLGPIGAVIAIVAGLGATVWYVNRRTQDAAKTTQSFMTVTNDMATLFNQKLNGMKANLTGLSENIDAARKRYEELKKAIDAMDSKSPIKKLIEDLKNEANPDVSIPAKLTSMYSSLVLQGLDPQKARDAIQVVLDEAGQGKYKMVVNAQIDQLNLKGEEGVQELINTTFRNAIIGGIGSEKYNAAMDQFKVDGASKPRGVVEDKSWWEQVLEAMGSPTDAPTYYAQKKDTSVAPSQLAEAVGKMGEPAIQGAADQLNNMLGNISAVNPAGFSKFVEDLSKSTELTEGFWMNEKFRARFIEDLGVVGTKYEDLIKHEDNLTVASQLAFLAQSGVSDAMARNAYEADKAANSFGTATSAIEAMVVAGTISKQLSLDISKSVPVVKASATASGKAAAVNSGYDAQKKTIEDRIKAIKAEMDAINKKLEAEKAEQDFLKKTRDLQISYREALASGNLGEAARIKNDLNNERLKRAQELSAKDKLDPKQAEIDKLQKRLDAIDKLKDAANNKTTENSGVDPAKQTKDLENAWTKVTDGISDGSIKSSSDIKKLLGTGVVDAVKGAGYSIDEFYNKARQTIKDSIQGSVKDLDETGQAVWKAYSKGSKDLADQLRTARIISYVAARQGSVEEALRLKKEGKLNVVTNKSGEITDVSVKGDVPNNVQGPGLNRPGQTSLYGVRGPQSVEGSSANTDLAKSIGGEFKTALAYYDAGGQSLRVRGWDGKVEGGSGGFGGAPKFHTGGPINNAPGYGGLKSDEVPAVLQTGEYVVQRSAVDKLGAGAMGMINSGQIPGGKPGYGAYFSGPYSNSALFEAADPVKSDVKKNKKSVANTGSADSTEPSFSFTGKPGSIDSAMEFLNRQAASGASTWSNLCERLARTAYGMPGMYASALDHFRAIPDSKVHGKSTGTAPKGSLGFWNTGPYGHVAVSAGGGRFYSNMSDGKVRLVSSQLLNSWGPVLGVTEPWWSNKYNASAGVNGTLPTYLTASYSEAQRNKGNGGFAEKGLLGPIRGRTAYSDDPRSRRRGSSSASYDAKTGENVIYSRHYDTTRRINQKTGKSRKIIPESHKHSRRYLAFEAGPSTEAAYHRAWKVGVDGLNENEFNLLENAGVNMPVFRRTTRRELPIKYARQQRGAAIFALSNSKKEIEQDANNNSLGANIMGVLGSGAGWVGKNIMTPFTEVLGQAIGPLFGGFSLTPQANEAGEISLPGPTPEENRAYGEKVLAATMAPFTAIKRTATTAMLYGNAAHSAISRDGSLNQLQKTGLSPRAVWNASNKISMGNEIVASFNTLFGNRKDTYSPFSQVQNALDNNVPITFIDSEGKTQGGFRNADGSNNAAANMVSGISDILGYGINPMDLGLRSAGRIVSTMPDAAMAGAATRFKYSGAPGIEARQVPIKYVQGKDGIYRPQSTASRYREKASNWMQERRRKAAVVSDGGVRQRPSGDRYQRQILPEIERGRESNNFFDPTIVNPAESMGTTAAREAVVAKEPVAAKEAVISDGGVKPPVADVEIKPPVVSDGGVKPPVATSMYDDLAGQAAARMNERRSKMGLPPRIAPAGDHGVPHLESVLGMGPQTMSQLLPEYASRAMEVQKLLEASHLEATTGRFADMPVTDLGQLVDTMGGFSSSIPGANGVYRDAAGQLNVFKGHDTLDSALAEARASELTQKIFGLETPNQSVIKIAHPSTGHQMHGVLSPQEARFANPTGEFTPDEFVRQALASIIRRDKDLQPDNLFGNLSVDQGQAYVANKAAQPRVVGGDKIPVMEQAQINFLMQKGGAKAWFAEDTAHIAKGMSTEEYVASFQKAIDEAYANAKPAIDSLEGLTPAEKIMYQGVIKDLEEARSIDFAALHEHHSQLVPKVKKPPTEAAVKKAAENKAKKRAQIQEAIKQGYPEWLIPGYNPLKTKIANDVGRTSETGASNIELPLSLASLGLYPLGRTLAQAVGRRIPRPGIENALDRGVLGPEFMDEFGKVLQTDELAPVAQPGFVSEDFQGLGRVKVPAGGVSASKLFNGSSQVGSSSISKLKTLTKRSSLGDKVAALFEHDSSTDMMRIISGSDEGMLMSQKEWEKLYYSLPEEARSYLPEVATVKSDVSSRVKDISVRGSEPAWRNARVKGEFLMRPVDEEAWMHAGHFDRGIFPVRSRNPNSAKNQVANNSLAIEPHLQGQNIATNFTTAMDRVYKRIGVDRNTVETGDAGTEVWGKLGFELDRYDNTKMTMNRINPAGAKQWLENMETYGLDVEHFDLYQSIREFSDGRNPGFSIQEILRNPEARKIFEGSGWYGEKVYPKVEPKKSPIQRALQKRVEREKAKARASTTFSEMYDQMGRIARGEEKAPKPSLAQTLLNRLTTPKAERSSVVDTLKGAGSNVVDKLKTRMLSGDDTGATVWGAEAVNPFKARAALRRKLEEQVWEAQRTRYSENLASWREEWGSKYNDPSYNGWTPQPPSTDAYFSENAIKANVDYLMNPRLYSAKNKLLQMKYLASSAPKRLYSSVGRKASSAIEKIKSKSMNNSAEKRAIFEEQVRAQRQRNYEKDDAEWLNKYDDDAVNVDAAGFTIPDPPRPDVRMYINENLIQAEVDALMRKSYFSKISSLTSAPKRLYGSVGKKVSSSIGKAKSKIEKSMVELAKLKNISPKASSNIEKLAGKIDVARPGIKSALDRGVMGSDFMDELATKAYPNYEGLVPNPEADFRIHDIGVGPDGLRPLQTIEGTSTWDEKVVAMFEHDFSSPFDMIRILSGNNEGMLMSRYKFDKSFGGAPDVPEYASVKANASSRVSEISGLGVHGSFLMKALDDEIHSIAGGFSRVIQPARAPNPVWQTGSDQAEILMNSVTNARAEVLPHLQGGGVGTAFTNMMDFVYPRVGVDKNTVNAAGGGSYVGNKVWAGLDFDFVKSTAHPDTYYDTQQRMAREFIKNIQDNPGLPEKYPQILAKLKEVSKGNAEFSLKEIANLDDSSLIFGDTSWYGEKIYTRDPRLLPILLRDPKAAKRMQDNTPALKDGGTINYDNTIANLHQGEMVLTQPLTQKLNDGINNLQYTMASSAKLGSLTESTPTAPVANNNTSHYNIQVHPTPGMSEEAVADKVMQKLKDHERRKGMARR